MYSIVSPKRLHDTAICVDTARVWNEARKGGILDERNGDQQCRDGHRHPYHIDINASRYLNLDQ
jgi:hypothetical protein